MARACDKSDLICLRNILSWFHLMVTCYAHRVHVADNDHMAYGHVTHMQDVLNANKVVTCTESVRCSTT